MTDPPFREINGNQSHSTDAEKTIRRGPKNVGAPGPKEFPIEELSSFEKMILVYKKKKLFNDILESRVISIKNRIHEKELCNKILKAKIDREAWDLGPVPAHNADDGDATFLSILSQTMKANNLDFSVDFSKLHLGLRKDEEE